MANEILAAPTKVCRKCGAAYSGSKCRPCANIVAAAYRAKFPEKVKAAVDAWNAKNTEAVRLRNKAYRTGNSERLRQRRIVYCIENASEIKLRVAEYAKRNAEQISKQKAIYYLKSRPRIRGAHREYYAKNSDKIRSSTAAWARANGDKRRVITQNRRARKLGGKLSRGLCAKLMRLQKGKCACCHVNLKVSKYHLDHIQPLSKGGKHADSNIQLLCAHCNSSKSARDPIDFMQSRGFLI